MDQVTDGTRKKRRSAVNYDLAGAHLPRQRPYVVGAARIKSARDGAAVQQLWLHTLHVLMGSVQSLASGGLRNKLEEVFHGKGFPGGAGANLASVSGMACGLEPACHLRLRLEPPVGFEPTTYALRRTGLCRGRPSRSAGSACRFPQKSRECDRYVRRRPSPALVSSATKGFQH